VKPELIIFDCDGVLIDSEVISNQVDVTFLAELAIHFTLQDYMTLALGKTLSDVMLEIEKRSGQTLPDTYAVASLERKLKAFTNDLQAIKGIATLLQNLHIPKAVASGSSPERLEHSLKITKLWSYFAPHIYSATMVKRGKPAPDLFLMVAETFGVNPAHCIVIEDSTSGVEAAVAAGMVPIGFTGGSHIAPGHEQKLLDLGALKVFSSMTELGGWLAE
jgi:HAD superfamily hydrolase (TIGR01509 family)